MSCPICARPADPKHRPFCSSRCADVDLAHWLRGSYVIPTDEAPDADLPRDGGRDDDGPQRHS